MCCSSKVCISTVAVQHFIVKIEAAINYWVQICLLLLAFLDKTKANKGLFLWRIVCLANVSLEVCFHISNTSIGSGSIQHLLVTFHIYFSFLKTNTTNYHCLRKNTITNKHPQKWQLSVVRKPERKFGSVYGCRWETYPLDKVLSFLLVSTKCDGIVKYGSYSQNSESCGSVFQPPTKQYVLFLNNGKRSISNDLFSWVLVDLIIWDINKTMKNIY